MSRQRPVIAISAGDPCGIGPEVMAKALADRRVQRAIEPVVFGDASLSGPALAEKLRLAPRILRSVSFLEPKHRRPGAPTKQSGYAQFAYVQAAIAAAKRGEVAGLCTAPVSKQTIIRAGLPFVGHTEMLAQAFSREVLMLLAGPRLKVALATNHLPLAQVPSALSAHKLLRQLKLLSNSLRGPGRRKPCIAVCGLNPHAGEGGAMGTEEVRIIAPAVARARRQGLDVHGPLPADGLFAKVGTPHWKYDVVLAMFHDQGLCVAKALDFQNTVNVTLGLPLPRTSPDHGTGYDIAGHNRADPEPMVQALLLAAKLVVIQ